MADERKYDGRTLTEIHDQCLCSPAIVAAMMDEIERQDAALEKALQHSPHNYVHRMFFEQTLEKKEEEIAALQKVYDFHIAETERWIMDSRRDALRLVKDAVEQRKWFFLGAPVVLLDVILDAITHIEKGTTTLGRMEKDSDIIYHQNR